MPKTCRFALASAFVLPVLLSTPLARAQLPTLGPEFTVSPPDYTSDYTSGSHPAMATNGTDALVAWEGYTLGNQQAVFCARFTAAGAVLDGDAIALALPAAPPSVFWDGSKYLVVTGAQGQRVDPATGALNTPLPAWQQFAPTTIPTAFGSGALFQAQILYNNYISLSLIDATTVKSRASIPELPYAASTVAVGYANGAFLVAWSQAGVIQAIRVTATGTVEDSTPIVVDAGSHPTGADGGVSTAVAGVSSLQITGSSSSFLLTWTDQRNGSEDLYAARVSADGTVADPGGFLVATNSIDGLPTATWTGTDWWLAWNGFASPSPAYSVVGTTIETNGSIGARLPIGTGPTSTYVSPPALAAALASGGATLFATWEEQIAAYSNIVGARFDATHTLLGTSGTQIESHLVEQQGIRLAASANGYMVGWAEGYGNDTGQLAYAYSAMRFAPDGTPIDAAPIPAFKNPTGVGLTGGMTGGYAVAYATYKPNAIQIATLSTGASAFVPLASEPTNTGGYNFEPLAFSCMPDRCVVVWLDNNAANMYPVYAAVVMADGTLTPTVSVGSAYEAVAGTDGSSFLVFTNYGAMLPVAADGTAGTSQTSPASGPLVWGGDRYLLFSWGATSNALDRLTSSGAAIGASEATPSWAQTYLAGGAGWDGRSFLLFNGRTAAEVPNVAPSTFTPTFSLFSTATPLSVKSVVPNTAFVLGSEPQGGQGAARAVARMMSEEDAGPPDDAGMDSGGGNLDAGGDSSTTDGGFDAGEDGGLPGTGDDAGPTDAGPTDAGTDSAPDAESDGGLAGDAAADDSGATDASPVQGGGVDATAPGDDAGSVDSGQQGATEDGGPAGSAPPPAVTQGGGCSCDVAVGGRDSGSPLGFAVAAAGVIAWGRRRRSGARALQ
jgi:MYXO-CTERM domain-containing protein